LAAIDYGSDDLNLLVKLAKEAGMLGMRYFQGENAVWYKEGNSPVSEADKEIDGFLRTSIARQRPKYGWLSEETPDSEERLSAQRVVIADPIDGTRGFIAGDSRWCISIALVDNARPLCGVLHVPALGQTFAAGIGTGLILENLEAKPDEVRARPNVTGSKKLIERLRDDPLQAFDVADFIPSLAYRLALVASGHLDGAFARPGASEWDVAAADIILREAGAVFTDHQSNEIRYNQKNVRLPSLLATTKSSHKKIVGLAKPAGILQ
jgi:myo-inositol-1(or 4)-monophosphatase